MRVLWVSRHVAKEDEREQLESALGEPVNLILNVVDHVKQVSDIVDEAKRVGASVLVVTLPLSLQEELLRAKDPKARVIRPVYRHRDERGANGRWEFLGYEEILEARTRTRRLGTWTQ